MPVCEEEDPFQDPELQDNFFDDVTGMELDARSVKEARQAECEYIESKEVWVKISRADAQERGISILKGRWVDVNKNKENFDTP
eukprot:775932-Amphidinium_carterae.1